ncbi:MAG: hypothetical protein ABWX90_00855 [Candidatus Saccharimonadales bacterium]
MNKQQRELVAIHTEMTNVQARVKQLTQSARDHMSVDLTTLNQKGLDEHYAKGVQIKAEIDTAVEEYKRLKTELDNALN